MLRLFLIVFLALGSASVTSAYAGPCEDLLADLDRAHAQATRASYVARDTEQATQLIEVEDGLFQALTQCPQSAELYALMGEVQISMGQLPLASLYGRKAVKLDARSWRAQQLLGSVLAMLGDVEAGIDHLERAVSIAPDNERVQLNLGSALVAAKRYDDVISLSSRLIESRDADVVAAAYHLRGSAYLGKARIAEANRDFHAARERGWDASKSSIDLSDWQRHLDESGEDAR